LSPGQSRFEAVQGGRSGNFRSGHLGKKTRMKIRTNWGRTLCFRNRWKRNCGGRRAFRSWERPSGADSGLELGAGSSTFANRGGGRTLKRGPEVWARSSGPLEQEWRVESDRCFWTTGHCKKKKKNVGPGLIRRTGCATGKTGGKHEVEKSVQAPPHRVRRLASVVAKV